MFDTIDASLDMQGWVDAGLFAGMCRAGLIDEKELQG